MEFKCGALRGHTENHVCVCVCMFVIQIHEYFGNFKSSVSKMNYLHSEWYGVSYVEVHSFMGLMWVCEKFSVKLDDLESFCNCL